VERKLRTSQVNIRIPDGILKIIDEDVEKDEFTSRADYIMTAIREFQTRRREMKIAEKTFHESGTLSESDFTGSSKNNIHGEMKLD